jgi:hypothetical protein
MSWGVATQNGVSVSLASIVSLSCGATEAFSPASLFTSGVAGAWYDPSDTSTLFQDSAGTTPVTAVEQPVGLMLDKSQGLVLGSDVVVNGDFATDTNWTKGAGWTISGGSANLIAGGYPIISQNFSYTIGTWYQVTFTVTNRVSAVVQFLTSPGRQKGPQTSANGTYTFLFLASAGDTYIGIQDQTGLGSLSIDNLIVKQLAGNHASQATAASRPILRARYNLLTYSEQFNNGVWNLNAAAVTANQEVAPDGTTTADKVANSKTTLDYPLIYQNFTLSAAATITQTVYAKVGSANFLSMGTYDGTVVKISGFNLSNGTVNVTAVGHTLAIVDAGGGWYRCSVTYAYPATTARTYVGVYKTSGVPQYIPSSIDADFIYIWGADARTGSSAGTYQRIAAATDYATAGFLPYLALDGTDDSFGTNSIDFSATDKMSVCAGVTKLSDAGGRGIVAELSTNIGTNNGAFFLSAPAGAAANYNFSSKGTSQADATTTSVYAAPITSVLSGQADISIDALTLRVNGSQAATSATDQGTGNYGTYPLYIGRRGGTTNYFNGRLYQMVICGKTLSASELASTEAYVNSKTGAY